MRVLIADDHPLFRDGLRSLLEARGIEVVGEARNGREAVDLARRLRPDVTLMDLSMPEMGGLDATRLISAEQPEVKVVILTASEDDADLFEAIKSGAQGYLFKNLASDEFFRLLDGVERGEPALSPALARKLLSEFARPPSARPPEVEGAGSLTEREREEALGRVGDELLQTQLPRPRAEIEAEVDRRGRWVGEVVQTTRDGRQIVVASRWAAVPTDDLAAPGTYLEID